LPVAVIIRAGTPDDLTLAADRAREGRLIIRTVLEIGVLVDGIEPCGSCPLWLFAILYQMLKAKVNPSLTIFLSVFGTNALCIEGRHPCLIVKESSKRPTSITTLRTVSLNSCEAFTSHQIRVRYPTNKLTFSLPCVGWSGSVITEHEIAKTSGARLRSAIFNRYKLGSSCAGGALENTLCQVLLALFSETCREGFSAPSSFNQIHERRE
jgi:hypothetical protein